MSKGKKTPEYILEKIALGDIKDQDISEFDSIELNKIKESNKEIFKDYPPHLMSKRIENKYNIYRENTSFKKDFFKVLMD